MNPKQLAGLIALSLGIILLVFSFDGRWCHEPQIKSEIITDSPISPTERLPDESHMELSKRWPPNLLIFLSGALLVLAGGAAALRFKSKP